MKIIDDLEQGSPSWLEWRRGKITATEVSIILGSNPFRTKLELWNEKLGFTKPQEINPAMARGTLLEPEARKLAIETLSIPFTPFVVESEEYPWLAASLDGLSTCDSYILEIKCPKEFTHLEAVSGNIEPYYIDQIQSQLLVTGSEKCFYFSYRPEYEDQIWVIVEVLPDKEKHERIIHESYEFYQRLCTMNPPEEWKFKERK